MAVKPDPRVDAYIAEAAPFAQPILRHLRKLVHGACPTAEEAMKWSSPFYLYRGKILCYAVAFKAHAAFGFWGPAMRKIIGRDVTKDGRGLMGRITSLRDLPTDKVLLGYIRTAMKFHDAGASVGAKRKPKSALPAPPDLADALKRNKKAATVWTDFSPGCRREYIEWITEARRPETREKRLLTTIEWLAEGKKRNWKYENC